MGILELPITLRHRIFTSAGLYRSQIIDLGQTPHSFIEEDRLEMLPLNFLLSGSEAERYEGAQRERLDEQLLPIRLMLTCRTLYHELLIVLATANYLHINLDKGGELHRLRRLPYLLVSNMRNLTIHLRTSLCTVRGDCAHDRYAQSHADEPSAMSLDCQRDHEMILDWLELWQCWSQVLPEHPRLTLRLTCDVADERTAQAVLRPFLRARRPLFRHCTIRLSGRTCLSFRSLADAAVSVCTIDPPWRPTGAFAFFKLPNELRQQILLQTDLVTEHRRMSWSPTYHIDRHPPNPYGRRYVRSLHGSVPWSDEHDCSDRRCTQRGYFFGCLCQTAHTVASNDSKVQCHSSCWAFPTALLLTCRQMYAESMDMVHRCNSITVVPSETSWRDPARCHRSLTVPPPAASFLERVSGWSSGQHLRKLVIIQEDIGCPSHPELCTPGSTTEKDWVAALTAAKTALDLPRLMLSIGFRFCGSLDANGFIMLPRSFDPNDTLGYCANTLSHIRMLEGLRHFFVYLPSGAGTMYMDPFPTGSEAQLERLVMGPDYDSMKAGKTPKEDMNIDWT